MKRFALIGAAGYIAPRHMTAIKETGNILIAALDKHDSVGVLDSYFPGAHFFTEFERFDRHLDKLRRKGQGVEFVSICSPNYLHDSHIRYALRQGAHAICEKPLVLNPWNIQPLYELERESTKKVSPILQLRHHPTMINLRKEVLSKEKNRNVKHEVELTYVTARGKWYLHSWKGDLQKSGGIATNIGIHFFDILQWIFGPVQENVVHFRSETDAAGFLEFDKARVIWCMSIDAGMLPAEVRLRGGRTYRSMKIFGEELEFSEGFTDLHTEAYRGILSGQGFGLKDAEAAIQIAYDIRKATPKGLSGEYHPFMHHRRG